MKKRNNMPFKTEIPIHFSCVYLHMCSLNIRCPKFKNKTKNNKTKQKNPNPVISQIPTEIQKRIPVDILIQN